MIRIGLSRSGVVAAGIVGTLIWIFAGWQGMLVLLGFFIPSTAISRIGREQKRALIDIGKHGPRDAMQVLANGGVATVAAVLAHWLGPAMLAAFAGALAAASADTWSSEIGTLAKAAPRSIFTFKPLAPGLSGGVTWQGSLAQVGGAAIVALVAVQLRIVPFWPVLIGGVAGSIADSLFGATLQSLRHCPACQRDCETNPHACGTPTTLRRGLGWFDNDAVNFAATLCGALVAGLM